MYITGDGAVPEGLEDVSWPELELKYGVLADTRIAANALVRSAVFSTLDYSGGAQRPEINDEPLSLAAIKPYRIEQVAGPRLSQTDADLFFWLLSRAYRDGTPAASACVYFTRAEALTALHRKRGGKTDSLLDESLQRLYGADFTYQMPGVEGRSRLVSCVERFDAAEKPYEYKVTISDGIASFLDGGEWIALSAAVRAELANDPLARGLYAFYASHSTAYPMLPATLKALMGRESMQESKWLHALKKALAKVKEATGWVQCEVAEKGKWEGKVVVIKGGTISRKSWLPRKIA